MDPRPSCRFLLSCSLPAARGSALGPTCTDAPLPPSVLCLVTWLQEDSLGSGASSDPGPPGPCVGHRSAMGWPTCGAGWTCEVCPWAGSEPGRSLGLSQGLVLRGRPSSQHPVFRPPLSSVRVFSPPWTDKGGHGWRTQEAPQLLPKGEVPPSSLGAGLYAGASRAQVRGPTGLPLTHTSGPFQVTYLS